MSKPAIAITGASGFIGSAVVRLALEQGLRVAAIVNIRSDLYRLEKLEGYVLIKYDTHFNEFNTINQLKNFAPDVFIHSGWTGVNSKLRNDAIQLDNIKITLDSIDLAIQSHAKQWIGIGSHAEYGIYNKRINEDFATNPVTVYGKVKLSTLWAAQAFCQFHNLDFSWIRLFDPFGPYDNSNWFIPYIIKELSNGNSPKLTECKQVWDYLYIDDAIEGILTIAKGHHKGIYNIGSGDPISLKEVITKIKNLMHSHSEPEYGAVPYNPDQVMHLEAGIDKIKALGWKPKTSIDDALRATIEYFAPKL